MLLSLLLTATLGLLPGQAADTGGPTPTHELASELARGGEYEAALRAFRQIAGANPRDLEARLWIARLHFWMGNPELAEPVYRSIVAEAPASIDARVGLGTTLTVLNRESEAIEVLAEAERLEPSNADVLAALGRAHRQSGQTTQSLRYLRSAVALSPAPAHRDALEQTRLVHDHFFESHTYLEELTGVDDARGSDTAVNIRINDRLRVAGRGQVQRKFGEREVRGGGSVDWRFRPRTWFSGQLLLGPGNLVLPETDGQLEFTHVLWPMEWVGSVRHIRFQGANVTVLSPGASWNADGRLSLGLRYYLSTTEFGFAGERENSHGAMLRAGYRLLPRLTLHAGYARGVENFETLSPDRIGEFRANTAFGGVRIDLPTLTSVFGTYEHQQRPGDTEMRRFTFSLAQRF